jgi:hypothetical protein
MPAVALQPSRPHAALIWLIRGTYVVIAIFFAVFLLGILVALPVVALFRQITDISNPLGYRITMVGFGLILILFYGFIVKRNYHNFRHDFGKVNADTAANFSFVFALLLVIDWYHLLPPHLPKAINEHLWDFFRDQGDNPGVSYRYLWSFLAFFLFNKLIRDYVMQVLNLNSPNPPQNSIPSVPSVPPDPSDPFVPFDPYDLSKNSPNTFRPSPPPEQM